MERAQAQRWSVDRDHMTHNRASRRARTAAGPPTKRSRHPQDEVDAALQEGCAERSRSRDGWVRA